MTETPPTYVFPQDVPVEDGFQREGGLEVRDYVALRLFAGIVGRQYAVDLPEAVLKSSAQMAYRAADVFVGVRRGG